MSALRSKMVEAMLVRGFSPRTHESYLASVTALARFHRRCPAELDVPALQAFFVHLVVERGLSAASCRLIYNGIRFLYLQVLQWPQFDVPLALPKRPQRPTCQPQPQQPYSVFIDNNWGRGREGC